MAEQELAGTPHVRWQRPDGTFYLWLDCRDVLGRAHEAVQLGNDLVLSDQLLEKAQVACVAGSAFGAPGFLRLSLTVEESHLRKGLSDLKEFFSHVE